MSDRYTSGPLTAGDLEAGTILQAGTVIYRLHPTYEVTADVLLADAKLYASAPDMLKALRLAVTHLPHPDALPRKTKTEISECVHAVRAAIAKATGK